MMVGNAHWASPITGKEAFSEGLSEKTRANEVQADAASNANLIDLYDQN